MTRAIKLRHVDGRYGVARLAAGAAMPPWLDGPGLSAAIRAEDELTIVCRLERIPEGIEVDAPWACFRSVGPFDFQAAGIVQSLVDPLSRDGLGVFVLCTFDGEHLLVAERDKDRAVRLLSAAGHRFVA